jgi:Fibrobacter succinogenes major domain (Fib_succ_major).
MTSSAKLNDSTLADADGNRYPVKLLSEDILWMTSNLNMDIPHSYCYDGKKENCERYGRLYTWESARKGCSLLGHSWRLPTNDEWRALTVFYGGAAADSNGMRKKAYKALLHAGDSKFNAVLGGGRDLGGQYARLEAHGFYWTATENDSSTAWFCNFGKGSHALYEQDGAEKARAFSVRCVRRIDTLEQRKR